MPAGRQLGDPYGTQKIFGLQQPTYYTPSASPFGLTAPPEVEPRRLRRNGRLRASPTGRMPFSCVLTKIRHCGRSQKRPQHHWAEGVKFLAEVSVFVAPQCEGSRCLVHFPAINLVSHCRIGRCGIPAFACIFGDDIPSLRIYAYTASG